MPALKICMVTGEFIGPRHSGGMGTATTGLAEHLGGIGHDVTVYFTRGFLLSARQVRKWRAHYAKKGVNFVPLSAEQAGAVRGPLAELTFPAPSAVLNYLLQSDFDLVHFNDLEAEGFLAVAARRTQIAFGTTVFVTGLHSPRAWIEAINKNVLPHPVGLAMEAAERFAIAHSDVLWGPSRYLLDWIAANGFTLPAKRNVQQYVLPLAQKAGNRAAKAQKVVKVVFFGRLEERKGLFEFLDALDLLNARLTREKTEVAFLGPNTMIAGASSDAIVRERAEKWTFAWKLMGALPHAEALQFLRLPGHLAIMASPADNSPCTVYEAMSAGIPFLAAASGGIPELISPKQWKSVLFAPNAAALAASLGKALDAPPPVPLPAVAPETAASQWSALHDRRTGWPSISSRRPGKSAHPARYGLVIADNGIAGALDRTLNSVRKLSHAPAFAALAAAHPGARPLNGAAAIAQSTLGSWLADGGRAGAALLMIQAGLELDSDAVEALMRQASVMSDTVMTPSVAVAGARIDPPFLSPALALALGPAPTGAVCLGARAAERALQRLEADADCGNIGIFGGLPDIAICSGSAVMPFPKSIGALPAAVLTVCRPRQSPARLNLYSKVPAPNPAAIARMAVMNGMAVSLFDRRRVMHWMLRSGMGPLIPGLERGARIFAACRRAINI